MNETLPEVEAPEILPPDIGQLKVNEAAPLLDRAVSRIDIVRPKTAFWKGMVENLQGAAAFVSAKKDKLGSKAFRLVAGASLVTTMVSACARPNEPAITLEPTQTRITEVAPPTETPEAPIPTESATATTEPVSEEIETY